MRDVVVGGDAIQTVGTPETRNKTDSEVDGPIQRVASSEVVSEHRGHQLGDVEAAVPKELLDASGVVALEFDVTVLDGPSAGKLGLEIRRETV